MRNAVACAFEPFRLSNSRTGTWESDDLTRGDALAALAAAPEVLEEKLGPVELDHLWVYIDRNVR